MIDIHCHILAGIDDGAQNEEHTLQMLDIAEADGIRTIIATPHFCECYQNDFEKVNLEVNKLNLQLAETEAKIRVLPGQEIYLDGSTLKSLEQGRIKGLNGSRYLLTELPMNQCPEYALDILYELRILGMVPILAHPERYQYIMEDLQKLNDFSREGCLFQINATSITGEFGRRVKKTAIELVKLGAVSFLASDAHGTKARKPELTNAYSEIAKLDNSLLGVLEENSSSLIKNQEITANLEKQMPKRSIFNFFQRHHNYDTEIPKK